MPGLGFLQADIDDYECEAHFAPGDYYAKNIFLANNISDRIAQN
jgi:hypothetical protein